jgi:hypothetical protein
MQANPLRHHRLMKYSFLLRILVTVQELPEGLARTCSQLKRALFFLSCSLVPRRDSIVQPCY